MDRMTVLYALKRIQVAMLEGRTSATSEANKEMTELIRLVEKEGVA